MPPLAPDLGPAIVVAALSACGFSLSSSLQHRDASGAPEHVRGPIRLIGYLLTRRAWLLGVTLGVASLVLHALALRLGPLAVVQPLMVSGVVLAVVVRAALDRRTPSGRELSGVLLTAAALAGFLVVSRAQDHHRLPHGSHAVGFTVAALLVVVGTAVTAERLRQPTRSAMLFGVSTGVLFGLTAGLLKVVVTQAQHGGIPGAALSWELWVFLLVGVSGTALNQRAYHRAPLAVSMPLLNIIDVVVALGFGWLVFGDAVAHDPLTVLAQLACLTGMALGLRLIAVTAEQPAGELPTRRPATPTRAAG
ncbi:MAG TPA: DMT family transporter [Segeticoccus sp.]|uniref:DMT family transporter n=1 Tax=Segeticoccus sp. TaxID=2706531 RepID=UPI002D80D4FD|nr:DMT family transporter [Segeticoccus sp.]HET8601447.1 DMT family transporter [Segeticoccus sp.]